MTRADAIRHLIDYSLQAPLNNADRLTLYDAISALGDVDELGDLIGVARRLAELSRDTDIADRYLRDLAAQP